MRRSRHLTKGSRRPPYRGGRGVPFLRPTRACYPARVLLLKREPFQRACPRIESAAVEVLPALKAGTRSSRCIDTPTHGPKSRGTAKNAPRCRQSAHQDGDIL